MYEVYVPFKDISGDFCYFFNSNGSVLYSIPKEQVGSKSVSAKKVFINNHYIIVDSVIDVDGSVQCLDHNVLTNNWFYRKDVLDISCLVIIYSIFFFGIPIYLLSRLFKRGVH